MTKRDLSKYAADAARQEEQGPTAPERYPWRDWEGRVECLRDGFLEAPDLVDKKSLDFIESLLDNHPTSLTQAQVGWLEDLEERYL